LRLLIGSTGSLLTGLVAQALGFVILARSLGTLQFGHLMTITALTTLANAWCGFGAGEVLRRLVSRDPSAYREALGHTALMILASGATLTALLLGGMIPFMPTAANPLENLQILICLVPINVIVPSYINLVENIFLARGDFARANLVAGGSGVVRALAAIVACGVFRVVTLRGWAIWWAGTHVCMCVVCLAATYRYGSPRWRVLPREIWLGGNLALSNFLIMLRQNIDVLVLSAVMTSDFVGVYGAGRRLITAALVVPGSFDRVVYSNLSIAGKHGPSATLQLAKRYLVYSLALSGATSLLIFLVAPLTPLIFGVAFTQTAEVIRILSWTVVSTAVQFVAFDAINAAERHRISTIVSGVANAAGAAMVAGLGAAYGIIGVYAALYLSDVSRGAALWSALILMARRQDRPTNQDSG